MPVSELKTVPHYPNSGDDVAEFAHAGGSNAADFHDGVRVATLHKLGAPRERICACVGLDDFPSGPPCQLRRSSHGAHSRAHGLY